MLASAFTWQWDQKHNHIASFLLEKKKKNNLTHK